MLNDLFFLPPLIQALKQADAGAALRQAFILIQAQGREESYQQGYQQFLQFLREAAGGDRRAAAEQILEQFCREFERPTVMELIVERDNRPLARCDLRRAGARQMVEGIKPGLYRVSLDTGCVLWEGVLAEADVIWTLAFPSQPWPLAADTGDNLVGFGREILLLQGSVVLRLFPGIEEATMEIEFTRS